MRLDETLYPIDRYLVESSKKFQMAKIINDNWKPEPALRPEDEIIVRELHDMLRSTTDDLKLLSGELSKFHETGVQFKSQPTPLDEEFNDKVHIEEIVNAKFHGYKIVEQPLSFSPLPKPKKDFINKVVNCNIDKPKARNVGVQANSAINVKKPTPLKNLRMSRPKIVNIIPDNVSKVTKNNEKSRNDTIKKSSISPVVSYNEIVYKHSDLTSEHPYKKLQKQNMQLIHIRSELVQQKIFNFDIAPKPKDSNSSSPNEKNVGVIVMKHDSPRICKIKRQTNIEEEPTRPIYIQKPTIRKISKISSCESTESLNNVSSSTQNNVIKSKDIQPNIKFSTKSSRQVNTNKNYQVPKKQEKRPRYNIEEWKKKLNDVYRQKSLTPHKKHSLQKHDNESKTPTTFNNVEYIPYSKLTLGGARISDIEKEITDLPIKTDLKLGPILGKIVNNRENLFDCPKKDQKNTLTTSDENLLQEVLNIEKTVSETLSKKDNSKISETKQCKSSENSDNNSYMDDFEDDNSDPGEGYFKQQGRSNSSNNTSEELKDTQYIHKTIPQEPCASTSSVSKLKKIPKISSNLSIKEEVDIFEYVHLIDTQETGTQSTYANQISLKETQTSPRNDKSKIQPIHNDLWPTIDPEGKVENLFNLEKDFIKKLILEEYGQIIENDITKPTASKINACRQKNVSAIQKNTQTSPARVKNVMTSPTPTKTRTTSPFSLPPTINQETNPAGLPDNSVGDGMDTNDPEDLLMSINLSTPRYTLRLPQSSREVITNLDKDSPSQNKFRYGVQNCYKSKVSSSSSADADYSSSEISSLGEIKFKRKQTTNRVHLAFKSDISSDHSSGLISGDILKSEGEMTANHTYRLNNQLKSSDGEMHLGSI